MCRDFVCKLDWGYYIVKVIYETNQRVLIIFPDKKYIIYKAYPDYDMVCPLCLVYESFFKSSHVYVCKVGCHSGSHSCSFDLNVMFIIYIYIYIYICIYIEVSKGFQGQRRRQASRRILKRFPVQATAYVDKNRSLRRGQWTDNFWS